MVIRHYDIPHAAAALMWILWELSINMGYIDKGLGIFGNVWGAAALIRSERFLRKWS